MSFIRLCVYAIALLILGGCGGGDSGSENTSISISLNKADFQEIKDVAPGKPVVVDVNFVGDGVVVGYPPSMSDPGWLGVTVLSSSPTTAKVELRFLRQSQVGNFSTTLRFMTGRQDGSNVKYVDLPVTAEVMAPFTASAPTLAFEQFIGNEQNTLPKAGFNITIEGSKADWRISSDVDWLTFSKSTGVGPAIVNVTANKAASKTSATIVVTEVQSNTSKNFAVTMLKKTNAIAISPSAIELALNKTVTLADLAKNLTITDSLNGEVPAKALQWQLKQNSASWLKVDKTEGSTATQSKVQLTVDNAIIALPVGTYNEKLVFLAKADDGTEKTVEIPVKLTMSLPSIQNIAPYVGAANQPAKLIIRGSGFNSLRPMSRIKIGSQYYSYPLEARGSDTQLIVSHPGLAEGRYTVSLEEDSLVQTKQATLVIQNSPATQQQVYTANGVRTAMVFDPERYKLYAYNSSNGKLETFGYVQNEWVIQKEKALAGVKDLALTHNGQQLLVAADNQLISIDLTNAEWPLSTLYQRSNPQCGLFFASLAALNDNKVAIASQFSSCSAKSQVIIYDLDRQKLFGEYMMMTPKVAASADGSKLIMAEHGVSPVSSVIVIDSLNYQTVPTTLQAAPQKIQLNQDGSRVLLDQRQVYDGSLQPIGTVGQVDAAGYRAHLSADGKHAYVLKTNSAQPFNVSIDVVDISAGANNSAALPVLRTITLPLTSNDFKIEEFAMISTPDNKHLFITIANKLIIQPIAN